MRYLLAVSLSHIKEIVPAVRTRGCSDGGAAAVHVRAGLEQLLDAPAARGGADRFIESPPSRS